MKNVTVQKKDELESCFEFILELEKLNYQKLIVKVREDKRDIENNYEKFAREKYYMSRSDEDVFVIEDQEFKKK